MKKIDMTGERYHRLVVIEESELRKHDNRISWICLCDCGNNTIATGHQLRQGNMKSCGCLKKDSPNHLIHGRSHTKEHNAWNGLRQRCNNPKSSKYSSYGERGITYDPRWDDFEVFLADVGEAPTSEHSLDRIDNDGPYVSWNCRWATKGEQSFNKRTSLTAWDLLQMGLISQEIYDEGRRQKGLI